VLLIFLVFFCVVLLCVFMFCVPYITGQHEKNYRNKQHGTQNIKTHNRTAQKKLKK
jgi:hypothetical protein